MKSFFPKVPSFLEHYPVFSFSLLLLLLGFWQYFLGSQQTANYLFLIVVVLGGIPLVYETIKQILEKNWGADIIAAIAIVTSLLLHEYVAGSIIIIMLSGGRALEDYALRNASDALKKLAELAPSIAHLVKKDDIVDLKVDQVREKDILLVKPGELIPVDGVIIEGETSLNEAALTGEPVPTHKTFNSAVLSGSVNLDNPIKIRAIRRASESKYEQIVALVRNAQATKAPIHRLANRYGAIFTPVVLLIAALTYFFSGNFILVLAVLVVATPCPLILATPIAIMGGINKSAKRGIIVRNGGALETVGNAMAVIFDKTGTLTFGIPKVVEIKPFGKLEKAKLLLLAASVERLSAHILAKSVVSAAHEQKLELAYPEDFHENFGKGVLGTIAGKKVILGNLKYLQSLGVSFNKEQEIFKKDENEVGKMVSFLAIDQKIEAAIVFGDEVRADIKEIIQDLKNSGIKQVAMLTGDNEKVANQVAKETGIDLVAAQSLPDEKVKFVESLKKKYQTVVMVGDGFNDAPALVAASVGIALGAGGSSVSSESADIILVVDDISKVGQILNIGRNVLKVAKQGIFFGMGASFVAMIFAAFGFIPPVQGAILQEVIDVIVILNALRTSR